ncbi:MAG TPA: hypothetical protein VGI39_03895, partial [Polyangiaceae bacterium]|jgi:hypothetical protein
LESALKDPKKPLTLADAATESGLALRDAERGLHWLTSEYRGHLRVTEDGDLLFLFPTGFSKPWQTKDAFDRALAGAGRFFLGAARFVVRAWLTIVLVSYAAVFLALIFGLAFARQGNDDRRDRGGLPGGEIAYVLFRVLGDALFWTFHPFSPMNVGYGYGYGYGYGAMDDRRPARRAASRDETPFYERVNRFFFGPTPPPEDPRENERKILSVIRDKKGRIGLSDVMRVTGLPREKADPLMARLMLDYEGDVEVSDDGGIFYRFAALRKTALDDVPEHAAPAAWTKPKTLPPLTGNTGGANFAIILLNGFNLVMSLFALDAGMTLERLGYLFSRVPDAPIPPPGTPLVLGVIPLVMSIALFALPISRAVLRPLRARKVAHENARLAVLRTVLSKVEAKQPVTDAALTEAWTRAAGSAPASKEITREVVALGGDAQIEESGEVRYRFVDLETEEAALEADRAAAADEEKKVGKVIFASDA